MCTRSRSKEGREWPDRISQNAGIRATTHREPDAQVGIAACGFIEQGPDITERIVIDIFGQLTVQYDGFSDSSLLIETGIGNRSGILGADNDAIGIAIQYAVIDDQFYRIFAALVRR